MWHEFTKTMILRIDIYLLTLLFTSNKTWVHQQYRRFSVHKDINQGYVHV